MIHIKSLVAVLAVFAVGPAISSPLNETRTLSKRGAVLTAQFATESEVDRFFLVFPSNDDFCLADKWVGRSDHCSATT